MWLKLLLIFSRQDRGRWVGYVSMVALVAYVVVFAVGVGSLPFFLPTELIPAGPRAAVISLGTMVNWACNFCVALAFPTVQSLIGVYSFLIFAGCMLLMVPPPFFFCSLVFFLEPFLAVPRVAPSVGLR